MMKNTSKTAKTTALIPGRASSGAKGVAIAAPAYGMQSVDRASMGTAIQMKSTATAPGAEAVAGSKNSTGLPDGLKSGIENLSGLSLDDVHVHFNSSKPAQLRALAYTQGTEIHVGPGQERHLPHEAWHVVQQKQGRVRATMQMAGAPMNNDKSLEQEADGMGAKAATSQRIFQLKAQPATHTPGCGCHLCHPVQPVQRFVQRDVIQRKTIGNNRGEEDMDEAASYVQGDSTRSTTAIVERNNGSYRVYAQARTTDMQDRIDEYDNLDVGSLTGGTGFHAEVLALQASIAYRRMAASQPICARCEALLTQQGIGAVNADRHFTRLWNAPWDNAIDENSPYPYAADGGGGKGLKGTRWGFDIGDQEHYVIDIDTWKAAHRNGW